MDISPYYQIKCIFVGMQNVGKSSLVNIIGRYGYNPNITTTVGIEFLSLKTELKEFPLIGSIPKYYYEKMDKKITDPCYQAIGAQIWDTAGSPKYNSIVASYLRDVDIAFLVYDVTNLESWEILEKTRSNILLKSENAKFVLVGCKSDLPITVSKLEIDKKSKEWGAPSYIVSCVQRSSISIINNMFYNALKNYHKSVLQMEIPPDRVLVNSYKKSYFIDLKIEAKAKFCCFQ